MVETGITHSDWRDRVSRRVLLEVARGSEEPVEEVKEVMVSQEAQQEVTGWVEELRDGVGSREGWLELSEKADGEVEDFMDKGGLGELEKRVGGLLDLAHPGHGRGHMLRDRMIAYLLVNKDDLVRESGKAERMAGFLGGYLHDVGTVLVDRYKDKDLGAAHAEVGAWLMDELMGDVMGENLRKMMCYAIAAHTDYGQEQAVQTPEGYVREPYWSELWNEGGQWHGVAVRVTRMADRADALGVVHVVREIMARMHGSQRGADRYDGGGWLKMNRDALVVGMKPEREKIDDVPTVLAWVDMFMKSADGSTRYSKDDHRFGFFETVKGLSIGWGEELIEVMEGSKELGGGLADLDEVRGVFKMISLVKGEEFDEFWRNFTTVWQELEEDEKSSWLQGFGLVKEKYGQYLVNVGEWLVEGAEDDLMEDDGWRRVVGVWRELGEAVKRGNSGTGTQ